jgi:catechol 2,3-dioxygenase-like lactoylglutathione lyase family enzyme
MERMRTFSPAWPKSIFAITLFVEDLMAAKKFYRGVFGLPVVYEDDNSVVFKIGDTLINLLVTAAAGELIDPAKIASREAESRDVFTLHVDDVDAMCAELTDSFYRYINSGSAWPETAGMVVDGYTGYTPGARGRKYYYVHYNPAQPEEHVSVLDKSKTYLVVSLVVFLFGFLGVITSFVAK